MRTGLALLLAIALAPLARATPALTVDRRVIDFGDQSRLFQATRRLTMRNLGDTLLTISAFQTTFNFYVTTPPPLALLPGAETAVDVQLNGFQHGRLTDTLIISSNDPQRPRLDVGLIARVVDNALTTPTTLIDFGQVRLPAFLEGPPITLTSRVSDPVPLVGFSLTGDADAFYLDGGNAPVPPHGSADLHVWFTPPRGGVFTAQLLLQNSSKYIELRAVGLESWLAATPGSVHLDPTLVGERSNTQVVTITNLTGRAQSIASIAVHDPTFELSGAGAVVVPAGGGVTFGVAFRPTAIGQRETFVDVTLDGAHAPELSVFVKASGVAPPSDPAPLPGASCTMARAPSGGGALAALCALAIFLRRRRA